MKHKHVRPSARRPAIPHGRIFKDRRKKRLEAREQQRIRAVINEGVQEVDDDDR